MGRAVKFLLPLAILIGAVAVLGMLLVSQAEEVKKLQGQLRLSQEQVTELDTHNATLMQQLKNLQTERKTLDERLASLHSQLSSATTDLEWSRTNLGKLQEQYARLGEQLDQERRTLQGQVSQLTSQRDDAMRRAEQLEDEKEEWQRSVSRWRERLALLDRDYRKLAEKLTQAERAAHPGVTVVATVTPENAETAPAAATPAPATQTPAPLTPTPAPATQTPASAAATPAPSPAMPGAVELPPIIVRKNQAGMTSLVRGRIVDVNDPHNFVVIDQGSAGGVRVGMAFEILRGSSPVGRVSVIRVRPSISACDIVRAKTPGPLLAGDLAVQTSP